MKAAQTHKSCKIVHLLPKNIQSTWPLHYLAYFNCFDRGQYYEAHDVLEELWLGCKNEEPYQFFKGLIQLAGSFVHMKNKRISPALRLFDLAWKNLDLYKPVYWGLDIAHLHEVMSRYEFILKAEVGDPITLLGEPVISHCLGLKQDSDHQK